jgi:hypothetical protein
MSPACGDKGVVGITCGAFLLPARHSSQDVELFSRELSITDIG